MIRIHTLVTVGLLVVAAQGVHAQTAASAAPQNSVRPTPFDPRWANWLGCWRPAGRSGGADALQLCIVPTADGTGIRRMTFAGDREVLAETLVADGAPQRSSEKDCTGTRQSRWAQAGSRLFLSSTLSCPNQPEVGTSGLSAMISADQWLDVQVIRSGGRNEQTRVQRFWRSSDAPPAPIADLVAAAVPPRRPLPRITIDDVIEAAGAVPPSAVEAWLSEGGVRVPVARQELLQLSQAHVNGNVIDLMVALYYPKKFEVQRASSSSGGGTGLNMLSDFYPGQWGFLSSEYGLGYGAYGVPFFFAVNNGLYLPNDIYFVPGNGGSTPMQETSHGQVVNGQGYTRVQTREPYHAVATQSGSGQYSSSAGGGSDSGGGGGSASAGSSGGGVSSGGYSGGGGSSTGLTAVPR